MDFSEHPEVPISQRESSYNWLPDFVYGGIDGAVTTFAVVAGVEGASLSTSIILILGFANLVADGFSMAVGKYSSDKAHQEVFEKIRQSEFRHLKEKTEHEIEEVREIMAKYGFQGKDLDRATEIITANPEGWVDLMMRNEFNMTQENVSPIKGALATFVSFATIGFIPLVGYIARPLLGFSQETTFLFASAATLVALFFVGTIKSKFTVRHWTISGVETMVIGGVAASIAYGIGFFLEKVVLG